MGNGGRDAGSFGARSECGGEAGDRGETEGGRNSEVNLQTFGERRCLSSMGMIMGERHCCLDYREEISWELSGLSVHAYSGAAVTDLTNKNRNPNGVAV